MNKILIWDLPIRVFHWGFALLLTASILLSLGADEHGELFRWHMLCGLGAVGLLVLRVLLGVVGSRYDRFWSFPVLPAEVLRYALGVFSGTAKRYPGLNPGSALAALAMFALVLGIVLTGVGIGGGEVEEVHGALAYSLMGVIALHLAGLAVHTWRHRENISLSMVTGRKAGLPEEALKSPQTIAGVIVLLVAVAWIVGVFLRYDSRGASTRLPLMGTVIQLGESGRDRHAEPGRARARRDHDDD